MSDSQKLKIELDGPEHGWLTMTLCFGDRRYSFSSSHVPNDLIAELVNALLGILDGYPETIARGNYGPTEYKVTFHSKDREIEFAVYETSESLAGKLDEERFTFTGTVYEAVRPFWKALRDLQSKHSLEEYKEQWREGFPEREMVELTERIRGLKDSSSSLKAV